ncbi:MAG: type II secretion system F family protein [Phycisphaeraceae bacterium]|nr:type II secretion system F family protein [Phycisphaeraceae bacterium]
MATYQYEALNASGQPQKGTIEAGSSDEAIQRIKMQGYFPTTVREQKVKKSAKAPVAGAGAPVKKKKKGGGITIGGVKAKQLTLFTRQLSTLQDAGLPLLRSLQILEGQLKPCKLKNVLIDVCEDVEAGTSLSESMAKHPRVFNRLYTKMVQAGEVGGVLDIILQRLSEFMEKAQKLKRKIKGAMVYPIAVISIAIIILSLIMMFIIPQFESIFKDFEIELPALTMWLINTSAWVAGTASPEQSVPGVVWILASPFIVMISYKLIRRTPFGRAATDWIWAKVPIFGPLIRKATVARFTRTLGTLISAGVPILEAIQITAQTCGNWLYERALMKVHDAIREGESFATPLRETKVCDALVVNMIDVGEETGDMDSMLSKIADNYDEEVDVAVGSLVSLLEPLMVIVLGGIVGTIVLAMFLPMISMIESLQ